MMMESCAEFLEMVIGFKMLCLLCCRAQVSAQMRSSSLCSRSVKNFGGMESFHCFYEGH